MRKFSVLEFFATTNIKLRMEVDQASTCNLQPWVMIFFRLYLILSLVLFG